MQGGMLFNLTITEIKFPLTGTLIGERSLSSFPKDRYQNSLFKELTDC